MGGGKKKKGQGKGKFQSQKSTKPRGDTEAAGSEVPDSVEELTEAVEELELEEGDNEDKKDGITEAAGKPKGL